MIRQTPFKSPSRRENDEGSWWHDPANSEMQKHSLITNRIQHKSTLAEEGSLYDKAVKSEKIQCQ